MSLSSRAWSFSADVAFCLGEASSCSVFSCCVACRPLPPTPVLILQANHRAEDSWLQFPVFTSWWPPSSPLELGLWRRPDPDWVRTPRTGWGLPVWLSCRLSASQVVHLHPSPGPAHSGVRAPSPQA